MNAAKFISLEYIDTNVKEVYKYRVDKEISPYTLFQKDLQAAINILSPMIQSGIPIEEITNRLLKYE